MATHAHALSIAAATSFCISLLASIGVRAAEAERPDPVNFSVSFSTDELTVAEDQIAEFLIEVEFTDGFTTTSGLTFSVQTDRGLVDGATFTPAPMINEGGVILNLDTSGMAPGTYTGNVVASETASADVSTPFTLTVGAIQEIRFLDYSAGAVAVTEKTFTSQGITYLGAEVELTDGTVLGQWEVPLTFQSSNPGVFLVAYSEGNVFYAQDNGTATLSATAPDGSSGQLQATVSVPTSPKITTLGLAFAARSEMGIQNSNQALVNLFGTGDPGVNTVGYPTAGIRDWEVSWNNPSFTAGFRLDNASAPLHSLGDLIFSAKPTNGTTRRYAVLKVNNDPSYGQIWVGVRRIDENLGFHELQEFGIEFYQEGVREPLFTHYVRNYHGADEADIGGITPGTYKLRLVPGEFSFATWDPQWYPNTTDEQNAQTVTIAAGRAVNEPFYFFPVGPPPVPVIQLSTATLEPECTAGADADADSFTVTNSGDGTLSYAVSDDVDWLDCTPATGASGGEADTIAVTYSTSGLTVGQHTATITVADNSRVDPKTIAVTLTVNEPPPEIAVSPAALTPSCFMGTDASADTFTVSNSGGGVLSYSIADDVTWLSCSPAAGSAEDESDTITVTYSSAALTVGQHTATITVADNSRVDPQTVSVTLTVITAPEISLSTGSLNVLARLGTDAPSQSFSVQNTGGSTLSYSITDDAGWMNAQPASGTSTTEEDFITVDFPTASLAAGNYQGTITVSDSNASNTPQTIQVDLEVRDQELGDVNGDGALDAADAILMLQMANGTIAADPYLADMDGDDDVDEEDAVALLHLILHAQLVLDRAGWHLIGAVANWQKPVHQNILPEIWYFAPDTQSYVMLQDGEQMVAGRGYWIYAVQSCTVPLEL